MFKSKPLLMLITGIVLALILWGISQTLQKTTSSLKIVEMNTVQESSLRITETTKPFSRQHSYAPASIVSAIQRGANISLQGNGVPGAGVSLLNEGKELSRTKVTEDGNWATEFLYEIDAKPIAIDVLTLTEDGQKNRSDQSLFVINYQHEADVNNTNGDSTLLLLTAPGAHSRVLQTPFVRLPQENGFALEVIDYDNSGGVIFSGSSSQAGKVLIYAGENLVGESRVDTQGRWSLIFGNIMPLGAYNISAELVITDGVSIRLTLPFERMKPLFEAEGSPKIVIEHFDDRIQIGRALFGGGYQYSVVYAPSALEE